MSTERILPDHCSVYKANIGAIMEEEELLRHNLLTKFGINVLALDYIRCLNQLDEWSCTRTYQGRSSSLKSVDYTFRNITRMHPCSYYILCKIKSLTWLNHHLKRNTVFYLKRNTVFLWWSGLCGLLNSANRAILAWSRQCLQGQKVRINASAPGWLNIPWNCTADELVRMRTIVNFQVILNLLLWNSNSSLNYIPSIVQI